MPRRRTVVGLVGGVLSGEERSGEGRSQEDVVVVEIGVCVSC